MKDCILYIQILENGWRGFVLNIFLQQPIMWSLSFLCNSIKVYYNIYNVKWHLYLKGRKGQVYGAYLNAWQSWKFNKLKCHIYLDENVHHLIMRSPVLSFKKAVKSNQVRLVLNCMINYLSMGLQNSMKYQILKNVNSCMHSGLGRGCGLIWVGPSGPLAWQ